MTTRILKVTIPPTGLCSRIQEPGRVVHVGWQGDEVCAWIETDTVRRTMPLILDAFATGEEAEEPWSYVGTAQSPTHPLVFHVFQQRVQCAERPPQWVDDVCTDRPCCTASTHIVACPSETRRQEAEPE